MARTYVREQSLKELRTRLTDLFQPVNSWCYQDVLSLPAIDEIEPAQDRTAIVISEPYVGHGLNPLLKQFWEQTTFKNRVAFLTGARNTFDNLIKSAKRLKAIQHIIDEMVKDKTPENDPQFKQADELRDRILAQFLSAVKETFSTLYYPTRQSNADVLVPADFLMQFEGNKYNGEDQIIQVLQDKQKYTIRPRYLARLTERFFTDISVDPEVSEKLLYPEIGVIEPGISASRGEGFGIATAPIRVATEMPESVFHFSVEIRDRHERRLVTSIEVLSPSNKGGEGRREYLAKRKRVLHSSAHLIEIDLLRVGQRLPMKELLPKAPYYIYVGRSEIRPDTDVWPITLDSSLPQVPVPLLAGDSDVMLDLQLALTTVYDLSDYDLEIDYTKPPDVPLSPEESDWLDSRLRTAGLRP